MKRWIALLFTLVLGFGCSGEVGLDDGSVGVQETRVGLVSVNYVHSWDNRHGAALMTSSAQFVRYSDMQHDQVARLLALPLNPQRELPDVDRCEIFDLSIDLADHAAQETEEQGYIELLEAGDLQVKAQDQTISMLPRHFPGLLPFISGVTYGESQTTLLSGEANFVEMRSSGGESVGPFTVRLGSPRLPGLTRLASQVPTSSVTLPPGTALPLEWKPSTSVDRHQQLTYVELRYKVGRRDQVLRCRLADDGKYEIPATVLSTIHGRVLFSLNRMRRSSFSASGLQRAELRVTVQDTATLQLQ